MSTCPVCEAQRKPASGFLSLLSAPARRAPESIGANTLKKLSQKTEKEISALQGVEPGTIPKLKKALEEEGLSFKKGR